MVKLIICFSEIPKTFISDFFLSEDRKQTGSNMPDLVNKFSALEHDLFMQVLLQTVTWLFSNT